MSVNSTQPQASMPDESVFNSSAPVLPCQQHRSQQPALPCTDAIVVIDDEPAVTEIIEKTLQDSNFTNVSVFNDPHHAVKHIDENPVDVVLLDLHIPEFKGLSILKYLRTRRETQYLPVIILTSSDDDDSRLEALSAGANEYLTKPVRSAELVQRIKNALRFKQYADGIENQIRSVKRELRIDALTGVNNRRYFDEYYSAKIVSDTSSLLSLILFDIDNFKKANDTYGHQYGDDVLKLVAKVADEISTTHDFVARIGGDEFAIVCEHENPDWPENYARQLKTRVASESVKLNDSMHETTISVGIATLNRTVDDKGTLFNGADAALYQSKRQGRNTINVYSDAGAVSIGDQHLTEIPKLEDTDTGINHPHEGRILIIDDEPAVSKMIELQLRKSGYNNVQIENESEQAVEKIKELQPDLVILDIRMPKVNGLEILRSVKDDPATKHIQILIMTSTTDDRIKMASLKLRANDFLTKPTNTVELDVRVSNALKLKIQHDQLVLFSDRLTQEVKGRTAEIFATRRETILCLARAAEIRDMETGNHVIRVGHYAAVIAKRLGMPSDFIGYIELAAQLHDVGKLSIPDSILHKPGGLTTEERAVIETHCEEADRIFFGKAQNMEKATITSPLLRMASRIASTHHERWDGSGYPNKLAGNDIPLEGRITAVADVFDALSTERPYKKAIEPSVCFQMIADEKGKHFDPQVVDAFLAARESIMETRQRWLDTLVVTDPDEQTH
jgi:putative two-component system response regulator